MKGVPWIVKHFGVSLPLDQQQQGACSQLQNNKGNILKNMTTTTVIDI